MTSLKRFWSFNKVSEDEAELRIEGDIIDDDDVWIYEWLEIPHAAPNAFRQALKEHKGRNITVWIDTVGGSTWAGAGIYNALKEHKGRVVVKIDGKALSAGSLIAMAGDEVLISPAGMLMIHNPWTSAWGEASDLRKVADFLDEVREGVVNAYEAKTGRSRKDIIRMMDEETYMSARKAVAEGFADGILYLDDGKKQKEPVAAHSFSRLAIQNSADASMRRFFDVWKAHRSSGSDQVKMRLQLELTKLKEVKNHDD